MRVAIVGSREYPDMERVKHFVVSLAAKYPQAVIVSGGAKGADKIATATASLVNLHRTEYCVRNRGDGRYVIDVMQDGQLELTKAIHYESFGAAAFARNKMIVSDSDHVVAFWDGESSGTRNTIGIARAAGKTPHVYIP